ncbi:ATP-binding protein [Aquiflexum sp. LQ15W]|uniref:ATP-binding protein n=1 Tax=Cognataquiflexum nitidum TaxID=2922272 RepID=UPI001F133B48|nr:ATP-binding protein [Cognataquiflexum nitidum]MCH6198731.1 ATP-binding protein [Cognataquiflexum nitidum]
MLSKLELERIIDDQSQFLSKKTLVKRKLKIPVGSSRIIIVSGVRRCGKSVLIRQQFLESDNAIYLNFEDPRLINFDLEDFPKLEELMVEKGKTNLLLDEVQIISNWEIYARMANEKGTALYITGSNASMLSRELGTKLTGRYSQFELFPFSYSEFLDFLGLKQEKESFDQYFETGGFPEYIAEKAGDYFGTLLRDILTRDIAVRKNINNEQQLIRLAVFLMSNVGKELSYNKISNLLEFKSVRTVIDYCDFMQESYLLEFVALYSSSIKKQIANPKKVYCIDPAFAKGNSLSFSKDLGRRLENFVFIQLRRNHKTIYYYRNQKSECDFLIKDQDLIILAIQVCWEVTSENLEREIQGIKTAIDETGAEKGIVITYNQKDRINGIDLIPAWQWLID